MTSITNPRPKRLTAALSCAECRRLKLRCSRIFPCTNCVKKGVAPICPDAALTTGKGNRFVLANTEVLHDKIGELSDRVRQLEDALSQSHSSRSKDRHPLLSEELLMVKRPLEKQKHTVLPPKEDKPSGEGIDNMGSLRVSRRGRVSFFGQMASSWYLLQNENSDDGDDIDSRPSDPQEESSFPFTVGANDAPESIRSSIIGLLPAAPVTQRNAEIYYKHAAWMFAPISQEEYHRRVFCRIYDPEADLYDESLDNLALLYMILALGTLLDPEIPLRSPEAMHYYNLGCAALSLDSVLEGQSTPTIQALLLMCHFMLLTDMIGRWAVMGLVLKLTYAIGLHRDSVRWNLSSLETQSRRELMWEIYTYDSWESLTFGRPPSFMIAHIDCQMPQSSPDETEMSFSAWKYNFSSQCLSVVHDQVLGAHPPRYETVQELDKKVREFPVPPSLQVPGFGIVHTGVELEQPSVGLTMQRHLTAAVKEITLFSMHRPFFARALEDNPDDLLGSQYSPSVLACYSSAYTFVALIESLFTQQPLLTQRMWFMFAHAFSCAVVLSSIAEKSHMTLAPSALSHLEAACRLFDQVSDNPRAAKVLSSLKKLKEQAYSTMPASQPNRASEPASPLPCADPSANMEADELFGQARFVSHKMPPSSPGGCRSTSSANSSYSSVTTPPPPAPHKGSPFLPVPERTSIPWQQHGHVQDFNSYSYNPKHGDPLAYCPTATSRTAQPDYVPGVPVYGGSLHPHSMLHPNSNGWYNLIP